jgi:hypothetical protein
VWTVIHLLGQVFISAETEEPTKDQPYINRIYIYIYIYTHTHTHTQSEVETERETEKECKI